MARLQKVAARVILSLAGIALLSALGLFWYMWSDLVPASKLAHMRPGMSTAEVRTLLGKPTGINRSDDGTEEWIYRSEWKFGEFQIHFSAARQVESFNHDR